MNSIVRTTDGYLWLGTFNGLVRFDGVRFTIFTVGNTPELHSDFINILKVTPDGSLWVGTGGGGLVQYRSGQFHRITEAEGFTESEVLFLLNSPTGELWVGTPQSVFRLEGNRFVLAAKLPPEMRPYSQMAFDRDGKFWLSTAFGLRQLIGSNLAESESAATPPAEKVDGYCDLHDGVWRSADGQKISGIAMRRSPTRVMVLDGENIWFRDWANKDDPGLMLRRKGRTWSFASNPFLNRHDINCFFPDGEGNVWIGLDGGGLVRLRPKQVRTYTVAQGLPSENIVSLTQDEEGKIWLARLGVKRGLSQLDPALGKIVPDVDGFRDLLVSSCYRGSDGTIWIGTVGAGLFAWKNGNLDHRVSGPRPYLSSPDTLISVLFEDHAGRFWIGTDTQGLKCFQGGTLKDYTIREGLSHNKITALAEDPAGNIWIGTGDGLNCLSPGGEMKKFSTEDGLGANAIHCLFMDHAGALWIGTVGGLSRLQEPEKGISTQERKEEPHRTQATRKRFLTLTTREGLLNDVVAQIIEDDFGHLWLGTNRGLNRLNREDLEAYASGRAQFVQSLSYGVDEGMVSEECGGGFQPACMKDSAGRLWFCTVGGPVVVDPASANSQAAVPQVLVEEAAADGTALTINRPAGGSPDLLSVPSGTRTLEIRFSAIEFGAPEKVAFRYRLTGFQTEWVDAGTRRSAFYTRLPPGKFQFQVIARNNAGVWNLTGASLTVRVHPTWWQTGWFRTATWTGTFGLLAGAYYWQISRLKRERARQTEFSRRLIEAQEGERNRIATELHDSLGQNLSVIKNSAFQGLRSAEQERPVSGPLREIYNVAGETVEEVRRIAQALRPYQIDRLGLTRALRSLAEQCSRAGELQMEFQADNLDGLFPPADEIHMFRIIQEALTNAARHSGAASVAVTLQKGDGQVIISIADDGRGIKPATLPSSKGGLGLQSMAERVQMLGGQLIVESQPGEGTTIKLEIPIRESAQNQS